MTSPMTRSTVRRLRHIPTLVVLATLGVVGLLTIAAAALSWWQVVVLGSVLLHLGTVVTVIGPWSRRTSPKRPIAKMTQEIQDLQHRVDALGSRLVASTERTRVELLDAMADRVAGAEERNS